VVRFPAHPIPFPRIPNSGAPRCCCCCAHVEFRDTSELLGENGCETNKAQYVCAIEDSQDNENIQLVTSH